MTAEKWNITYDYNGEKQWKNPEFPGVMIATHEHMTGNGKGGFGVFVEGTIPAVALFDDFSAAVEYTENL